MTWTAHHRRSEVLHRVVDAVDLRRDGRLPTDLPGVAETFADDLDLVGALHLRWHQRLVGQVEQHQQQHPDDLERGVREGWAAAAASVPGIRLVLDHALAHPADEAMARALGRATVKERVQLALLAGLASAGAPADPRAEAVGRRLETDARALWRPGEPLPATPDVELSRRPVSPAAPVAPRTEGAAPGRTAGERATTTPTRVATGSPAFVRRLRAALGV